MRVPEIYVKPVRGEPFRFPLDKDLVVVGSSKRADLVLADEWVSRSHMEIRRDHGRYYLHDLGSRSGTYLNGVRISGPVPLQNGDAITLGDHQLRFVFDASGSVVLEPEVAHGIDETAEFSTSPGELRGKETWDGRILGRDRRSTRSPQALPALTVRPRRPEGVLQCLSLSGVLRRWVAVLRALVGRPERPVGRFVDCSLFAPPRITPGRSILVQAFIYLDEDQELMQRLATTFDSEAHPRGFRRLATAVSPGSRLLLVLRLPGLEVAPSEQSITWQGRFEAAQFVVTAHKARSAENVIGTLLIVQDQIPIGSISFKIEIADAVNNDRSRETGVANRYQEVFISYASGDRRAVQARVQMLQLVGIKCYQDLLSLDPGDRWERKLYRYIDLCDGFFLFWSSAARASEWVEKEWRYALTNRGDEIIVPVIIEGPPVPDPPPELSHLHFNDRMLWLLNSAN